MFDIPDTSNIVVGMIVSGDGVQTDITPLPFTYTTVAAILSSTSIQLSRNAIDTGTFEFNFAASPPAKRFKGFECEENVAAVKVHHLDQNLSDDTGSGHIDLSGNRIETQDLADEDLLYPYDWDGYSGDDGTLDSTKISGANYESWQNLAFTVCLESDDRICVIVEDSDSINNGDPVRSIIIQSDEFRYDEAKECIIDENMTVLGEYPDTYIIRDDFQKAVDYANRIFRKMRAVKKEGVILYRKLDLSMNEGDYIAEIRRTAPAYVKLKMNAPVMSVALNLQDQTTTYKTQYDISSEMEAMHA
jgi:hypothetical protein